MDANAINRILKPVIGALAILLLIVLGWLAYKIFLASPETDKPDGEDVTLIDEVLPDSAVEITATENDAKSEDIKPDDGIQPEAEPVEEKAEPKSEPATMPQTAPKATAPKPQPAAPHRAAPQRPANSQSQQPQRNSKYEQMRNAPTVSSHDL